VTIVTLAAARRAAWQEGGAWLCGEELASRLGELLRESGKNRNPGDVEGDSGPCVGHWRAVCRHGWLDIRGATC